jgi:hypothetical protein
MIPTLWQQKGLKQTNLTADAQLDQWPRDNQQKLEEQNPITTKLIGASTCCINPQQAGTSKTTQKRRAPQQNTTETEDILSWKGATYNMIVGCLQWGRTNASKK